MRILILQDWNARHGGAEAYVLWLRDALRQAGDEVRLLTGDLGSCAEGTADYVARVPRGAAGRAFAQIYNRDAYRQTQRAVREFRPDAAWINMFALQLSPAAIDALGDLPKLLIVSDYKITCPLSTRLRPDGVICRERHGRVCLRTGCLSAPHWLRDQWRYRRIGDAVSRCQRVVACSDWVRDDLAASGVPAETVPWPVPPPSPGYRRMPAPDPLVLYVGRLSPEKGVDVLLRAFAAIRGGFPQARLRIAGDGPDRAPLEALARELGLQSVTVFTGWLAPAHVEDELSKAWVAVAPSLWAEPFGLVAAEAIVHGVPAIVSATGGLAEIVEPGVSGLVVPNGDVSALAGSLHHVLAGGAFASRTLAPEAVVAAQDRFRIDRHVAALRLPLRSPAN